MLAVLGPNSINDSKFSPWSTRLVALGLEWDTVGRTVSMPTDKIANALGRVSAMMEMPTTTKHELSKLLGSLRHVCTCIPSARAFFQRLIAMWRSAPPYRRIRLTEDARRDLRWFKFTLQHGRLNGIPTAMFGALPVAVHFYMDASDQGLCVLNPAAQEYVRIRFDDDEQRLIRTGDLSINVREQLSVALALIAWGPLVPRHSAIIHIRCWIDNSSAVAWCDKRSSTNPFGQEINRVIGALEGRLGIHTTAAHLPGKRNVMADLGSREWQGTKLQEWTDATLAWNEQEIPAKLRKLYMPSCSIFNYDPSPTHLVGSMLPHGVSGATSSPASATASGSPSMTDKPSPFYWHSLQQTSGATASPDGDFNWTPCEPKSAMSRGIIASFEDFDPSSTTATHSPSLEWARHPCDD